MKVSLRVEKIVGHKIEHISKLTGGCIADVYKADLDNGTSVVFKLADGGGLATEGYMLDYLARTAPGVPVPNVLKAEEDLLVMEHLSAGDPITTPAQRHLADLIAALHSITGEAFGHERDTLIGPLPQRNTQSPSWVPFYRDHRLLFMADLAMGAGKLPVKLRHGIDRLADRLGTYLEEPDAPRLLHGDLWGGNILVNRGSVVGLIDPAIYYGHPEVELAFMTLFDTVDETFFRRYSAQRPLDDAFFEVRRDLYLLYPLLVHLRLFGGGYVGQVERIVRRFGG